MVTPYRSAPNFTVFAAIRSVFFRYYLMISLCLTIIPIMMGIIKLVTNDIMTAIVLYILLGIIDLALTLLGLAIAVRRHQPLYLPL